MKEGDLRVKEWPGREGFGRWWVFIILAGIAMMGISAGEVGSGGFILAFCLAMAPVPLYLLVPYYADRFRPQPRWILIKGFLAAGTTIALAALVVTSLLNVLFTGLIGSSNSDILSTSVLGPIVEESLKGALVVIMFGSVKRHSGVIDGIVYATVVGLGFAATENILYYSRAWIDGTLPATFVARGVLSPFLHPTFTAMTGIGLGLAATRKGAASWAPACGLGFAMLLHGVWNASLETMNLFGVLMVEVLVMIPAFIFVWGFAVVEYHKEQQVVRGALLPEVAVGLLAASDVEWMSSTRRQVQMLRFAKAAGGAELEKAVHDLVERSQEYALALQAHKDGVGTEDIATLRREMVLARARVPGVWQRGVLSQASGNAAD